jgi:prepilin-type N-terminal cleavage/methylation domain-containing protein
MIQRVHNKIADVQEHSVVHGERGFTLFELLVVMFLVVLILSVSAVFIATSLSGNPLQSTIREISSTMKFARSLSEMNGEAQIVTIDLDEKKYHIKSRASRSIPKNVLVTVIDPSLEEISRGRYDFVIYPFGGIEGGAIMLEYKNRSEILELDPVAGMVAASKE